MWSKKGECINPRFCHIFNRFIPLFNKHFGFDLNVLTTDKYNDEFIRIKTLVEEELKNNSIENIIKKFNFENYIMLKRLLAQLQIKI